MSDGLAWAGPFVTYIGLQLSKIALLQTVARKDVQEKGEMSPYNASAKGRRVDHYDAI